MAVLCGAAMPPVVSLSGAGGSSVPFFVSGTDPDAGGVIDMITESGDYAPDPAHIGTGATFLICIETAAAIEVQLADENDFTITAVQATAYLGTWYPALINKVYKTGTTGTFSVGV